MFVHAKLPNMNLSGALCGSLRMLCRVMSHPKDAPPCQVLAAYMHQ